MTARILLAALKESPARDAATLADLAHLLANALANRGWSLVPTELDDAMRLAIWRAQGEYDRLSPLLGKAAPDADFLARDRVADPLQRQKDQAAWSAAIAEAATRDG